MRTFASAKFALGPPTDEKHPVGRAETMVAPTN